MKELDSETGEAIISDLNDDGVISDGDMTYLGKAIPDFTYGLNISLAYKGLDLNVFGAGVAAMTSLPYYDS